MNRSILTGPAGHHWTLEGGALLCAVIESASAEPPAHPSTETTDEARARSPWYEADTDASGEFRLHAAVRETLEADHEAATRFAGGPLDRLRHHVTGAVERGEAEPVTEVRPTD